MNVFSKILLPIQAVEIGSEIGKPCFEDRRFCRPTKMDFDQPNVEICQKISNG